MYMEDIWRKNTLCLWIWAFTSTRFTRELGWRSQKFVAWEQLILLNLGCWKTAGPITLTKAPSHFH